MIRFWLHLLFVLVCFSLWQNAETRRAASKPKPPKKPKSETENAVDKLSPGQNIDINQMNGKWYLICVASRCKPLLDKNTKQESTFINLEVNGDKVSVRTSTKLNYECWEIKQNLMTTKTPGHLILKGKRPIDNLDIYVVEADYSSYAILVFKKAKKVTMKLYGRSGVVPDDVVDKFENLAKTYELGLDVLFHFPYYGFCESADKVLEMI